MIAGLAMLSAIFAAVIVLEWRDGTAKTQRSGAAGGAAAQIQSGPAGAPDPIPAAVATILARPLFEPDRRPVAALTTASAADRLPRLTGILVTPLLRQVIFAAAPGGKPLIAGEGAQVGRYVVRSISAGEVTISGPGGLRTIKPAFVSAPAVPTGAAAPVAPGPGGPIRPAPAPTSEPSLAVPPPPVAADPGANPNTITLPLRSPS